MFQIDVAKAEMKKLETQNEKLQAENCELREQNEALKMRPSPHTEANARRRESDHWKAIYAERDAVSKLSSKNDKLQQKVNTAKRGK